MNGDDLPIKLLTRLETAAQLRVSAQTAGRLITAGQLQAVRIGVRGVRVVASSVDAYLAARLPVRD